MQELWRSNVRKLLGIPRKLGENFSVSKIRTLMHATRKEGKIAFFRFLMKRFEEAGTNFLSFREEDTIILFFSWMRTFFLFFKEWKIISLKKPPLFFHEWEFFARNLAFPFSECEKYHSFLCRKKIFFIFREERKMFFQEGKGTILVSSIQKWKFSLLSLHSLHWGERSFNLFPLPWRAYRCSQND